MRLGALGPAISSADIVDHRRGTAGPRSIIAGIGPDLVIFRSFAPGIEYRGGGLNSEKARGSSQSLEDVIADRAQINGCLVYPVGKGGSVKLDALTGIDLRLPVERRWSAYVDTSTCALSASVGMRCLKHVCRPMQSIAVGNRTAGRLFDLLRNAHASRIPMALRTGSSNVRSRSTRIGHQDSFLA